MGLLVVFTEHGWGLLTGLWETPPKAVSLPESDPSMNDYFPTTAQTQSTIQLKFHNPYSQHYVGHMQVRQNFINGQNVEENVGDIR